MRAGIGMVHQELAFCPDLSVAENLCMGQYPRRLGLCVDRAEMRAGAREAAGADRRDRWMSTQPMRALSTAQEQLVQIASAVGHGARILVFDEPTSSLSEPEAQELFTADRRPAKRRGVTMIYVSHRMPEVFRLCDRISVLRDGKYVGTLDRAGGDAGRDRADDDRPIGRRNISRSTCRRKPAQVAAARAGSLARRESFSDVSFEIRAGEIVGFAGLVGAGRSEVAKAIFGLDPNATGRSKSDGRAAAARLDPRRDAPRHRPGPGRPQTPGAGADDVRPRRTCRWRCSIDLRRLGLARRSARSDEQAE